MKPADPAIVKLGPVSLSRRLLPALTYWSTFAMLVLYVCAPPVAPGVLVGCLLPPLVWCRADGIALHWGKHGPGPRTASWAAIGVLAYILWMFLSTLWSPNQRFALQSAIWSLAILAITLTVMTLALRVSADTRLTIAHALLAAMALGVLLVLWEAVTNMSLRRLAMSLVPPLRSRSSEAVIENGWVLFLPYFLIKKNVAVLMIMFWPALLIAVTLAKSAVHKRLITAAAALFAFTVMIAGHDTSKVALGLSGGIWLLALASRHTARRTAIALWLLASLAVVPITLAAYKAELHKSSLIQYSGRHRLVIWGLTAENVLKHPVIGAGLAATRYIDEHVPPARPLVPGTDLPESTNVHSHNIFLQTWHELGAVGAVLLAIAGLPLISWIGRRSDRDQPYLYATFATVAVMGSLSWSLIAAWFAATFAIAIILAQLATNVSEDHVGSGESATRGPSVNYRAARDCI